MIEKRPFNEIQTERLILKPHEATFEYAQKLYDLIVQNKEHVSKFMPLLYKVSRPEDEYNFCLSSEKNWSEMTAADYGVWTKDGQLIGTCSFVDIDYENCSGEIGYWLDKKQTGKGYMTEAVRALENEFFNRGFNRIIIMMDTENSHSENVAIRRAFSREGLMRQYHFNPYFNSFRNLYVYSKLKSEKER